MAHKTSYDDLLHLVANAYTLPFDLLEAQVVEESSGRADAFRFEPDYYTRYIKNNPRAQAAAFGPLAACSYGLLQVMLETAYELGFTGQPQELFTPRVGLTFGAQQMRKLLAATSGDDASYRAALAAYNGGAALLRVDPSRWSTGVQTYVANIYRIAGRT